MSALAMLTFKVKAPQENHKDTVCISTNLTHSFPPKMLIVDFFKILII